MILPLPLYVDEISPDHVKATVSNSSTCYYNFRMMTLDMPPETWMGQEVNGVTIAPVGRFICMMKMNNGIMGMIILDLVSRKDIAERMAEKLGHVYLQERFMQVYDEIMKHPERHKRYRLVVGNADEARY